MSDCGTGEHRGMRRNGRETAILNRVAKEGLTEVALEEETEEEEGGSHADNWGKSSAGTGNKGEGPEVSQDSNCLHLPLGREMDFKGGR